MTTRVFFAGSSEYSVACFDSILGNSDLECVGVTTQEDRKIGRKREIMESPVATWATDRGLKVFKSDDISLIRDAVEVADLGVLISFGQILRVPILEAPKFGWWNFHPSNLPQFRGASPLHATILAGLPELTCSWTIMESGLDCGPILSKTSVLLSGDEKIQDLEHRSAKICGQDFESLLQALNLQSLQWLPQSTENVSYVGKIAKNDGEILFSRDHAVEIERKSRAYFGWPGVFFSAGENKTQFRGIHVAKRHTELAPGSIVDCNENGVEVQTSKGTIWIEELKRAGKQWQTAQEYLNGYRLQIGDSIQ